MSSSSNPDLLDSSDANLEKALEEVIAQLEQGEVPDTKNLFYRFPDFKEEIAELIENWLGMERRTGTLASASSNGSIDDTKLHRNPAFGDYRLKKVIGSGGMGVIYEAEQISLSRPVAVKMILNPLSDRSRFRIEAEAAASLHHDSIVSIYEVGEIDGQPFLSMQYIEGRNLRDHVNGQPQAPEEAAKLVASLARAVHYAHQRGILHRDLKPANILLDCFGKPYVTDFGLAKQLGASAELTRSGAILGTPAYMSPEQAMGQVKSITVTADVYGLGAILYTLLTGEAPFTGESDLRTLRHVVEDDPKPPRTLRPDLDCNIETVCLKCLEKNPSARYQSAALLAEDLARYLRKEPVHARPISTLARNFQWCQRNPTVSILSLLVAALLACSLVFLSSFAYSEYQARIDAEDASIKQMTLRREIERARDNSEQDRQAAILALADLYAANGLSASRQRADSEALLWFLKAVETAPGNSPSRKRSQMRCLSLLRNSPIPIAALQLDKPFQASTFHDDMRLLAWRPTADEIMFRCATDFVILRPMTGETWRPSDWGLAVSAACWDATGKLIALGCNDGELRILDADTREPIVSTDFPKPIRALAFSSSGSHLAIASGKSIQFLNTASEELAEPVIQLRDEVLDLRFSQDDSRLLSVSKAAKLTCFEWAKNTSDPSFEMPCFLELDDNMYQHYWPQFSVNGSDVFVRTSKTTIHRFDATNGKKLEGRLLGGDASTFAKSENDLSWVCCGNGYSRIWDFDAKTHKFSSNLERLEHDDQVTTTDFSSGEYIATAGHDRSVRIWRVDRRGDRGQRRNAAKPPLAVIPHLSRVVRVLFSPDGSQLATFQLDGLVRIWRLPTFQAPGYAVSTPPYYSVAKAVDRNSWLISGATHSNGTISDASLRRISDGKRIAGTTAGMHAYRGRLMDSALRVDGLQIATAHALTYNSAEASGDDLEPKGLIRLWQVPSSKLEFPPIELDTEPRSIAYHPLRDEIVVLTAAMELVVVKLDSGEIVCRSSFTLPTEQHPDSTHQRKTHLYNGQLHFSPDGKRLFAWGVGRGVHVWDCTEQLAKTADKTYLADEALDQVVFSSSKNWLAAIPKGGSSALVLDSSSGQVLATLRHPALVNSVSITTSGEHVLTGCEDGRARLFAPMQSSQQLLTLKHSRPVLDVVFSRDQQRFASLTEDSVVRIWYHDGTLAFSPQVAAEGANKLQYLDAPHRLLVMGANREIQVMNFNGFHNVDRFDSKQLRQLARLIAGKRIAEAGVVEYTSQQWLALWNTRLEPAQLE